MEDDVHVPVEGTDPFRRSLQLRTTHVPVPVQDLALQVRGVHHVVIHQAERSDASRCQVERGGRSQPSRTHEKDARARQGLLPVESDFGKNDVPCVAVALGWRQRAWRHAKGDPAPPGPVPSDQSRAVTGRTSVVFPCTMDRAAKPDQVPGRPPSYVSRNSCARSRAACTSSGEAPSMAIPSAICRYMM